MVNSDVDADLIVVGAGAAGLAAARAAVAKRARVMLITDGPPGGDCTFTGCVPSKTLLDAAARGESFEHAMHRVRTTVDAVAATETADVLRREGIGVVEGRARFVSQETVAVGGRTLRARAFVVATGSRPAVPRLEGLASSPYLTSDSVFGLTAAPSSMCVLGAGPVGCELAQAFARLGVAVTLVDVADGVLPGVDAQAGEVVARTLASDGVTVMTGASAKLVEAVAGGVRVHIEGHAAIDAERLLVATGREPVVDDLVLDAAGVRLDASAFVDVDDAMRTSSPRVFAAGDVTGRMPFTHAADEMGRVAAGNALRRRGSSSFDATAIPCVVFTDPEVAWIGTGESDARGGRVALLPLDRVDRARTSGRTDGFVKLIAGPRPWLRNAGGGRLLGATIVAPRAGEMIHEVALAMRTKMFTGRLAQTVHAYPTWSTALRQAAAQFFGTYDGMTARPARRG